MDQEALDLDQAVSLDVELVPFEDDKGRFGCRVAFLGTKRVWFTKHHESLGNLVKAVVKDMLDPGAKSADKKQRPRTLRLLRHRSAAVIEQRPQSRDLRPEDLSEFCTDLYVLLDWPTKW